MMLFQARLSYKVVKPSCKTVDRRRTTGPVCGPRSSVIFIPSCSSYALPTHPALDHPGFELQVEEPLEKEVKEPEGDCC